MDFYFASRAAFGGARSGTGSVDVCNRTSLDPCNSNVWVTMYPNQNKKARSIWNRLFLCMPVPLIIMPNFSLKIKQNVTHCLFSFYLNIFLRRLI